MLLKEKNLYIVFVLSLFSYLAVKSILSPLVYDEAITFMVYVQRGESLPGQGFWSANNHVLNSILIWCSYHLFGTGEIALRLPNLLAFLPFAYFLFKIGVLIKCKYIRWSFWLVLLTSHFFIEFFSLARGYGLSFMLFASFIWFVYLFETRKSFKHIFLAFVAISLATLANLNLFFILLAFYIYSFVRPILIKPVWSLFSVFLSFPITLYFLRILFKLSNENELYLGGDITLFDTFNTVVVQLVQWGGPWYTVFLLAFLLLGITNAVWHFFKSHKIGLLFIACSLFLFNIIALVASHVVMQSNLPYARTALTIYFLLILILFFWLDSVQWKLRYIVLIPFALIPLRFISVVDFNTCSYNEWADQQIPQEFYTSIAEELTNGKILNGPLLNKHWCYYNLKLNKYQTLVQNTTDHPMLGDYVIAFPRDSVNTIYEPYLTKEETQLTLYKRKKERSLSRQQAIIVDEKLQNSETFIGLAEIELNEIKFPLHINIQLEMDFAANEKPCTIVFDGKTGDGSITIWEDVNLDNLKAPIKGLRHYHVNYGFNSIEKGTEKMLIYVYNPRNCTVNSVKGKLIISQIIN